jgi:hypothetical protein
MRWWAIRDRDSKSVGEAASVQEEQFLRRQGPASQRQSSFGWCEATSTTKRKQSDRRAALETLPGSGRVAWRETDRERPPGSQMMSSGGEAGLPRQFAAPPRIRDDPVRLEYVEWKRMPTPETERNKATSRRFTDATNTNDAEVISSMIDEPRSSLASLTPWRVLRGFGDLVLPLGTTANAPKPCGRPPRRPKGCCSGPAPRYSALKAAEASSRKRYFWILDRSAVHGSARAGSYFGSCRARPVSSRGEARWLSWRGPRSSYS